MIRINTDSKQYHFAIVYGAIGFTLLLFSGTMWTITANDLIHDINEVRTKEALFVSMLIFWVSFILLCITLLFCDCLFRQDVSDPRAENKKPLLSV